MNARLLISLGGGALALPILLAALAGPDAPGDRPSVAQGRVANTVTNFGSPNGHPEWAVLRDKKPDTTPYKFGHKMHNDPEAAGMQDLLRAIREGKSEADLSGKHTGRAQHIETRGSGDKAVLAMSCTFCHEMDPGGAYMKPIRYDTHCVDCHTNSLGVVGAKGDSLNWVGATITSSRAQALVRPAAIPHGTAKDAGDAVQMALGAWIAEQPPQFPVKAATPPGAEGEKKADAPAEKPAEESSSRRRRGGAGGGDAPKPEEAKPADAAPPPAEGGGGRRRGGGGVAAGEAAKPTAKATMPTFADQAAFGVWLAGQRKEVIAGKVVDACGKCHVGITPGGDAQPEAFKISEQKIPEVWLKRSHFGHAAHAMVSCVSCHSQATTSSDTKDVMLPSVASCRECHAPNATPAGNAAPYDCVLCHTYHERLPQSVQGRMSIDEMRRGGRVVVPTAPAGGGAKPAASGEKAPASDARPAESKPAEGEAKPAK